MLPPISGGHGSTSPEQRRRKVRKGTRSCWECKRRKVRCIFASASDAVCIPCRRRGATCLGQEVPEHLVPNGRGDQRDRIERMEALLRRLGVDIDAVHDNAKQVAKAAAGSTVDGAGDPPRLQEDSTIAGAFPTPVPSESTSSPASQLAPPPVVAPHGGPTAPTLAVRAEFAESEQYSTADAYADKLAKLSKSLFAACPAPQDVQKLCTIFKDGVCFGQQYMTRSLRDLELNGPETIDHLAEMPSSKVHPVLLARWMLHFAFLLQQAMPLDSVQLSECPWALMARLKDTATCLVATNEELFGTLESLECILLESGFENCRGHFRRAWLAIRRAMTAAQLMNLHRAHPSLVERLDPNSRTDARFLWFKIVYMDRVLCLMLGLPPASIDIDLPGDLAQESPVCHLQRVHAVVSKRILERNESKLEDGYAMTESIDAQLLAAAEKVPHQFWQPLDFSGRQRVDISVFWETTRLVEQMSHFNLLNHLHLPYLLCVNNQVCASSKVTCAHASREILTRWRAFRIRFPLSSCCRVGDFIALRAGLALCLAHLSNHHHAKPSLALRHQRLGDRSLIEQLLEIMKVLIVKAHDPLAKESSELLQRLLDFEANAAQGQVYSAEKTSQGDGVEGFDGEVLSIVIPYFGAVKISPKGVISKENYLATSTAVEGRVGTLGSRGMSDLPAAADGSLSSFSRNPPDVSQSLAYTYPDGLLHAASQPAASAELESSTLENQQPHSAPFPIAGVEDWAFQGVDSAFFDSLLRGIS